jgi:RNA 3'-terminal phosphate cyclase (ATP)
MIEIDGSERSGSGTILRYAVGISALLGEDLHLTSIRAKRDKPGLRPQHLQSVLACAEICAGRVEGARVGAKEILFQPGKINPAGRYQWEIGTAGSTTMLALTVLPLTCFAPGITSFRICGGLFQDFAPSAHHMQWVLSPTLKKMGIDAHLEIIRPGYVPRGEGIIEVAVSPVEGKIKPFRGLQQGRITKIRGVALSSHLREKRVSERMAESCQGMLKGYDSEIEPIYDDTSRQEGASLAIYAETSTGCLLGSDRAGERRRSSEQIGKYVAKSLLEDISTGAVVDRYLADQLILYAALAEGISEYSLPRITEHVDTNLWLVQKMLGAKTEVEGNRLRIEGIGFQYKGRG